MTASTLAAFLLARLDEDEAAARAVLEAPSWLWPPEFGDNGVGDRGSESWVGYFATIAHVERHDPARVLREVEAKRAIVELHRSSTDHGVGFNPYCVGCWEEGGMDGAPSWPCRTLRHLGSVYRDHPDFDEGWLP